MSKPSTPEPSPVAEPSESFEDILSQYEKSHSRQKEDGGNENQEWVGHAVTLTEAEGWPAAKAPRTSFIGAISRTYVKAP
jgi:hypothetical protein